MTDSAALTDEELAEHENQHVEVGRNTAYVTGKVCRVCKHQWPCPTTRLITDLRAKNERIKELEANQVTHEYDEETGYCLCTCCRHGV